MDNVITEKNKPENNKSNIKELFQEDQQKTELIDTSIFDETLREINQILKNLEKQSGDEDSTKLKTHSIRDELKKNINNINETILPANELEKKPLNEIAEHKIDENLLSIDELNFIEKNDEQKTKKFFGFYSYLALTVTALYGLYEILNFSKDLIISKYPITLPYIQYFYETLEILSISMLNFADLIKNKI